MLNELGLDAERVEILPNTFDDKNFQPAPKPRYLLQRHGLKAEQQVILTVCRLAGAERYKGYDQILSALPAILRVFPEARYLLVGKGADRARIQASITAQGLSESVILAGYVPDYELPDYYNLCDVFAMPSKREGFGIVFLEALASGKPVLAGNQDGSVDALLGGELGVLINPNDTHEIESALIAIIRGSHPLGILRSPRALRARVTEAFGFPRFVKAVAWHLQQLGVPCAIQGLAPVTQH
jgi:glycosyltransferase involved in cell wall biosynthesis